MTDPDPPTIPAPTALPPGYELTDDPARVDLDVVWEWLSTHAYWGRWRERGDVRAQVEGAWRVVSAIAPDGRQVGFARALSDGVTLAYLADVFVTDEHRGLGLGKALVARMVDDGPGAEFRWMLHTRDAHALYAQLGFGAPDPTYLERPSRGRRRRGFPVTG